MSQDQREPALAIAAARDGSTGLLVGSNYHPHDSDPGQWERDIELMRRAGLRVARLGHLAWDSYEPSDGVFTFDWFDTVMDLMADAGIAVILDVAVRPAPIWLHRKHPSIDIVDSSGTRLYPHHRYLDDVGDPDYRRHAVRFTDAITRGYADHPALVAFGIDNEPGDGPISYSEAVRLRFIAWLRDRYGDHEGVNRAWATHRWSRRLNSLDEIGLPVATHRTDVPERLLDFRRFVSDEVSQTLAEVIATTRRNAPAALLTTNSWYYSPLKSFDWSPVAYAGELNRLGGGFYPGLSLRDQSGVTHALFGISRVRYEATTPFWCTEFTTMAAAPRSVRLSAYTTLLQGNQLVCGWTWQTMSAGEEQHLEGMVDWDGEPNRMYDEYRQLAEEFDRIGHLFPYRPRADVAIAYDFASQITSLAFTQQHEQQAERAFGHVHALNLDGQVVDLHRSALDHRLLVVAGMTLIDHDAADKLRTFVHAGGTVIMTSGSAMVDEHGQVHTTTRPGLLSDVFGIRLGGHERISLLNEAPGSELSGDDLRVTLLDQTLELTAELLDVIELRGATILASAASLQQPHPVVTEHAYGAGRAIYVGITADDHLLPRLLDRLCREVGLVPPVVPSGVLARYVDDHHLLVINTTDQSQRITVPGRARGLLSGQVVDETTDLPPFDVEVIELSV